MTDDWHWYAGLSDEVFTEGPFETRQEAIASIGEGYIVEARKAPLKLSDYFDVEDAIERAEETAYDLAGEDGEPLFDYTFDQIKDLKQRIRGQIDEWQVAHGLVFMPWVFTETRNEECLDG